MRRGLAALWAALRVRPPAARPGADSRRAIVQRVQQGTGWGVMVDAGDVVRTGRQRGYSTTTARNMQAAGCANVYTVGQPDADGLGRAQNKNLSASIRVHPRPGTPNLSSWGNRTRTGSDERRTKTSLRPSACIRVPAHPT